MRATEKYNERLLRYRFITKLTMNDVISSLDPASLQTVLNRYQYRNP